MSNYLQTKISTHFANLQSRLSGFETQIQWILPGQTILGKDLGGSLLLLGQLVDNMIGSLVLCPTELQKMDFIGTVCDSS